MNASPKIDERPGPPFSAGIVAYGRSNVRDGIEARVRLKFARKLAGVGLFQRLLIHHRIHRVVKRKMKRFPPFALYSAH
jgi:hypothetical protein